MIEPLLKTKLEPIAQRQRRLRLLRGLALCFGSGALVAVSLLLLRGFTGLELPFPGVLISVATIIAAIAAWARSQDWQPDFHQIARQIENEHPELHALLLTAVEQHPDSHTGQLNFLQERVIEEAIVQCDRQKWVETVSDRKLAWMRLASLATLAVLAIALAQLGFFTLGKKPGAFHQLKGVTVTPGDIHLERGSGLVVLARFETTPSTEVTLVTIGGTNGNQRVKLVKNLSDPVFGGSIPEVGANLEYHVEYGGERTPDFKVTVFDYPNLLRADAHIEFPEYTGLPEKRVEDTKRVSAVEGSKLEYLFQLNKAVASAKLVTKSNDVVQLTPDMSRSNVYVGQFTLEKNQKYELILTDQEGRTNKVPPQIDISVVKNRAPELKFAFPRGDQRVSALEEVSFEGEVWDDFGVKAYGIATALPGKEPAFAELGKEVAAGEKQKLKHILALEELSAQPDQFLNYFLWADDIGPDGKLRRTMSDMYFAEIKPFEEIFREGQSGQSQGEQAGSQSEKLAELQKQIINATWRLQRQEKGKTTSPQYKKDVGVVHQSQQKALDQVGELKSRISDPKVKLFAEEAEKEMEKAEEQLGKAEDKNSAEPLPPAVSSEQSAYQALLKLQAREYQVSRNRGQGQGSSGQRAQRQLDELDLKQSENRYENTREAQKQNPEQQEQLQTLARLKELAQRQQDLNERLKEMQTALQEAKTEQEKEDIRRQLKRLREEEQQILADVDELRQKMAQSQTQSQMSEARKQLDQTRSEVHKASEELDKGAVSQALASGTRAQRDLQQMREDFRKKSSSQFADEMRQLRSEARDLAQKQEEIGKKFDEMSQSKLKTLSDSGERKELSEQLGLQKAGLTNLVQNMRHVTEQAEASEPLLSKQLYDTLRKSDQQKVDNKLGMTGELLDRGFMPQAGDIERQARAGIDDLKNGVERAAESVLGDETEALRMARNELDELSRQLEREMDQAESKPGSGSKPGEQGKPGRGQQQAQKEGTSSSQPGSEKGPGQNGEQQQLASGESKGQSGEGEGEGQQPQDKGKQGSQGKGGQQPGEQSNQARAGESQGQGQEGQGQQGQQAQSQGKGQGKGQAQGEGQGQEQSNQEQAQAQGQGKGQGQGRGQGQGQNQGGNQGQGQQPALAQADNNQQGQPQGDQPGPGGRGGGNRRNFF